MNFTLSIFIITSMESKTIGKKRTWFAKVANVYFLCQSELGRQSFSPASRKRIIIIVKSCDDNKICRKRSHHLETKCEAHVFTDFSDIKKFRNIVLV